MKYSLCNCKEYTIDKYYKVIQEWEATDIQGNLYKPATSYNLIELTREETATLLQEKQFSPEFLAKIEKLFPGEYFFKLSLRSPKDVLEKKYPIHPDDNRKIKLKKKIKQLNVLKVRDVSKVEKLLLKSKRTKEDLNLYINEAEADPVYLVFQPWRPNLGRGVEYRCFINHRKLVGICLYKPEYYSTRSVIPVNLITHFVQQVIQVLKYKRFVVDVYEQNNRIYFIEINPFEEFIDTFSFDWDTIASTENLIVTL